MNIRVTGQTQSNNAIAYMQEHAARLAKYQDQISSGLKIKVASDDPGNYSPLILAKAAGLRFDAYSQTMTDATADLNAAVSSLGDANSVLTRAKQIAIEGADGSTEDTGHEALAVEVDALIGRLIAAGNMQNEGKYIFSGTATGTPPFRVIASDAQGHPLGITYDGAADRARVLIGPRQTADTKYVGSSVFQQSGADAFQALMSLRDTLRDQSLAPGAKSQAISQLIGALDTAQQAISGTVGEQSSRLAALDTLQNRLTDMKLASAQRATNLEGTDLAEAVVRMQEHQASLQATMEVTAKLMEPSLLDFIR